MVRKTRVRAHRRRTKGGTTGVVRHERKTNGSVMLKLRTEGINNGLSSADARRYAELIIKRFPDHRYTDYMDYRYNWVRRIRDGTEYGYADYETTDTLIKIDGIENAKKRYITMGKEWGWHNPQKDWELLQEGLKRWRAKKKRR